MLVASGLTEDVADLHGGVGPSDTSGVNLHGGHVAHVVKNVPKIGWLPNLENKKGAGSTNNVAYQRRGIQVQDGK